MSAYGRSRRQRVFWNIQRRRRLQYNAFGNPSVHRQTIVAMIFAGMAAVFPAGARNRPAPQQGSPAVIMSEFIFEKAAFAQCHASTIAEASGGLVAAWFGGTSEGRPDVGIWLSRHDGRAWSRTGSNRKAAVFPAGTPCSSRPGRAIFCSSIRSVPRRLAGGG
jgi:hypothetical protein